MWPEGGNDDGDEHKTASLIDSTIFQNASSTSFQNLLPQEQTTSQVESISFANGSNLPRPVYNLPGPVNYCNPEHIKLLSSLFQVSQDEKRQVTEFFRYAGPVLTVICFISIIFNIIIISISRRGSGVNKSQVLLLSLNLALTDILATMLSAINFLQGYLHYVHQTDILTFCQFAIVEVFRSTAVIASALHLLALAFIHYRGTVDPIKSR